MFMVVNALVIAISATFVFGQLAGLNFVKLNNWRLAPLNRVKLTLFFGAIYSLLGIFPGLFLGLIGFISVRLWPLSTGQLNHIYIGFCSFHVLYFILKWTRVKSEFLQAAFAIILGFVSFFISFKVSPFCFAFFPYSLGIYSLLFLPSITAFISYRSGFKSREGGVDLGGFKESRIQHKAYDTGVKVLLIGVDAADWRMINPLIEKGMLPNIAKIKKEGFTASADSFTPACSAMLWTSIATGRTPKEHGIVHWQKIVFPGIGTFPGEPTNLNYPKGSGARKIVKFLIKKNILRVVPYTSESRNCKALWNVLSDFAKKSATAGWLFSWPAEKVEGINVSWYTYPFEEVSNEMQTFSSSNLARRTYPEGFLENIRNFIVTPRDIDKKELAALGMPVLEIDYRKRRFADQIYPWYFAKDKTFYNIADYILDNYKDLSLVSVLFSGIDAASHTYWPFVEGAQNSEKFRDQILSISDDPSFKEASKGFNRCIELYYQFIDTAIGKLISKTDRNWTIIIASDHGFRYDSTGHGQAPEGVFMGFGNNIEKRSGGRVSIYDIFPTIMALLGLPLAGNLKGRVLKEAIREDFLRQYPLQHIETYEDNGAALGKESSTPKEVEEGLTSKLRALGYID
ncbi:MAG: alkaline phosphatase family protein [Candidatus Omnitrophica bacterium]|nr:alkaline phosphatase family protein [Candidatus Omnitrophota bacterium]